MIFLTQTELLAVFYRSLLSLFLCLCLLGCDNPQSSYQIIKNGLVYCSADQPSSFNPQLTDGGIVPDSLSSQLFDRLVQLDEGAFLPIPMLAIDWQISKEGKQYDFILRQDVHFHTNDHFAPTRKLNAKDVVFSFDRLINQNNPFYQTALNLKEIPESLYPWFESIGFLELIEKVEAIGEYQVRFSLTHPDASFLSVLASSYAVIHSEEYAKELIKTNQLWNMDNQPIGTGPFWFREYQPNRLIRLKSHDLYWQGKPKLKQVVYDISYRGIGDLSKLLAKECDLLSEAKGSQLAVLKKDKNYRVIAQPAMNVAFLSLNHEHPILSKQRVRQAIHYAINRKALSKAVFHGTGIPASSLLPPISWAHDEQSAYEYDPQLAKSLLAHAGLIQGFDIDLLVPLTPRPYNPNPLKMARRIKADLAKINIRVNILTKPKINHKLWKKQIVDLGMVLRGWVADNADPDNFMRPFLSCAGLSSGINLSHWCNEKFETLLDSAIHTDDKHERKVLYAKLQQLIRESLPVIPLTHGTHYKVISSKLTGYKTTPFGDKNFATITRDQ